MSVASAEEALATLRSSARALGDAIAEDDDDATAQALGRRDAALAELERALRREPGGETRHAALVDEVRRLDAAALALAREHLERVRAELEQLGRARAVARSLASEEPPARFVSKRV